MPSRTFEASLLASALLGALTIMSGSSVSAQSSNEVQRLVVLGDSLSDIGNAGRYSNGPVWVQHLAADLGLELEPSEAGGTDYAIGGARLNVASGPSSLRAQADRYLADEFTAAGTLYIVLGGGNDLLGSVGGSDGNRAIKEAMDSLRSILEDLVEHGATEILVPNLPDVGMTPSVRAYGPRAVADGGELSRRFNDGLADLLADFSGRPNLRIHALDIHAMAERARRDPGAFGFSNVTEPCSGRPSCEGYIFWDGVHPTTAAHRHLAEAAASLINRAD